MHFTPLLLLLPGLPLGVEAAETVLGAYIFHRHGDRTTKSYSPVSLTSLGAEQVYLSGSWYRNRYVAADAPARINGIAADVVKLSQLAVTSPVDNVLQNSAQVFLQGLYPPAGTASAQKLANGTVVNGPLGGYQYIPVNADSNSASSKQSEENGWLQGGSGCPNAIASSGSYFDSSEYLTKLAETKDFYQNLLPVYEQTFPSAKATFENAYTIYDFVHVSTIHNASDSIPSNDLLTPQTQQRLLTLASEHEWGLAFNSSEPIRAASGSVLAGHIVQALSTALTTPTSQKLTVQFGAYGTFMSFFGLSQAPAASADFYGIVDYASSFVFELVTDADPSSISTDDVGVRFLFVNGTASDANPPRAFSLFGQTETTLKWKDFESEMNKFSLHNMAEWCAACGSTEGVCAGSSSGSNVSSTVSGAGGSSSSGSGGISTAVAGVIGAMVTLAVILGLETLILGVGGLRVVKKKTLRQLDLAQKMSHDDASSMEKV
ncbi:phosphoglycerate mutase-like protein [Apodospora peruviana]|uniref:Phosphoglycerate mutase-like protein n=1 Tax=Apodospora peruviana TaxID=516989 RepID=A0AAE0I3S4_9PEZI|nr:phosphoglycerate mutase-like protein [Apodospora peruviana]